MNPQVLVGLRFLHLKKTDCCGLRAAHAWHDSLCDTVCFLCWNPSFTVLLGDERDTCCVLYIFSCHHRDTIGMTLEMEPLEMGIDKLTVSSASVDTMI